MKCFYLISSLSIFIEKLNIESVTLKTQYLDYSHTLSKWVLKYKSGASA